MKLDSEMLRSRRLELGLSQRALARSSTSVSTTIKRLERWATRACRAARPLSASAARRCPAEALSGSLAGTPGESARVGSLAVR